MTDHRNFANRLIAVFLAVIAACAVVVTIKMSAGISVKQPRVLDPAALRQQVTDRLGGPVDSIRDVECPLSVVVKVGDTFNCNYSDRSGGGNVVTVKIISDQGGISVEEPGRS